MNGWAQAPAPAGEAPAKPAKDAGVGAGLSAQYVVRCGDLVMVQVYQEEDMKTTTRIGKDGTLTMPLLGAVKVASNTVAEATAILRDLLAKDYLVNPQVTVTVVEFAKRRFTVLGQVTKPGSYEIPPEEPMSLFQAIALAGGYTRIGNPRKIKVTRMVGAENQEIKVDAEAMAANRKEKPFEILPDDVIIVGEKWF